MDLTKTPTGICVRLTDEERAVALRGELQQIALLGESTAIHRLRRQLTHVGPHYRTALLVGEVGSGREAVARHLHGLSPVAAGPFVPLSAMDLVDGHHDVGFGAAKRGTLFIREMEGLPLEKQARLLQQLNKLDLMVRSRSVETRVVAASQHDLRSMATAGHFRQDLYGRVAVVEMKVASLRDRMEDIQVLCLAMLERHRERQGGAVRRVAQEAMTRLEGHAWPGNLQELQEVMEAALERATGEDVVLHDLPGLCVATLDLTPALAAPAAAVERLEDVLRRHVLEVLSRCAGNKVKAADLLGISRSTLYRMLEGAAA